MEKEYYLCSEQVIELLKPLEFSESITVYPTSEIMKENVRVAVLDFSKVKSIYDKLESEGLECDFWVEEIVSGTMNVDCFSIKNLKGKCPFVQIEYKLGLTKMNNRAMTICNISEREGLTPIELWNKIA